MWVWVYLRVRVPGKEGEDVLSLLTAGIAYSNHYGAQKDDFLCDLLLHIVGSVGVSCLALTRFLPAPSSPPCYSSRGKIINMIKPVFPSSYAF